MRAFNIALLTYSTKPRGGVAHTLSLGEHLARHGHGVHVYALSSGSDFYRNTDLPYTLIPLPEKEYGTIDSKIEDYIGIYTKFLASIDERYDIYHAEDCISANALLNLREAGLIESYVRTIHHIDDFTSEVLIDCQLKSIVEPDHLIAVSKLWEKELLNNYSLTPAVINNGVEFNGNADIEPESAKEDARERFSVKGAKVMLSVGGIEPRKNTLSALRAFNIARAHLKTKGERLVWLIGGGETLFDYRDYRDEFFKEAEKLGLEQGADFKVLGNVPESDMPTLYKAADVFVFPSIKEGWGLVVLEAMAAGVPVIASGIEPMTEYLTDGENAVLIKPTDYQTLANEVVRLLENPELGRELARKGLATARAYSWENTALKHIEYYDSILGGSILGKTGA